MQEEKLYTGFEQPVFLESSKISAVFEKLGRFLN